MSTCEAFQDTPCSDFTNKTNNCPLLDKIGYLVTGDFHKCQRDLMLKNSTWDHIWWQKEGVSGIKHFYWVPLCLTIMFLYIKFSRPPQKLVIIKFWSVTWPRIWLQLRNFTWPRCETSHRFQCVSKLCPIYRYRSGTVNSNTVNSKFHSIQSFFEIFA